MVSHLAKDSPTDDSKERWMEKDVRLFLQIYNSIDSKVLGLINHYEFVKELMNYLEFLFIGKGNVSLIFDVCKAFYQLEKKDQYLTKFCMDYKKTYEELNMLMPFSQDAKVQQTQREQMATFDEFSGKGNVSLIFDVCKPFYRSKKKDQYLTKFIMDYKNTYEELNMLIPFS